MCTPDELWAYNRTHMVIFTYRFKHQSTQKHTVLNSLIIYLISGPDNKFCNIAKSSCKALSVPIIFEWQELSQQSSMNAEVFTAPR